MSLRALVQKWRNLILACVIAFAVTIAVILGIHAYDVYKNPSSGHIEAIGQLQYEATPVTATLQCDGAEYLVGSTPGWLTCKFWLKSKNGVGVAEPARDVYVDFAAAGADVQGTTQDTIFGWIACKVGEMLSGTEKDSQVTIRVRPAGPSDIVITFRAYADKLSSSQSGSPISLGTLMLHVPWKPPWTTFILPYMLPVVVFALLLGAYLSINSRIRVLRLRAEAKIAEAAAKASGSPGVARFAWDLARFKLEAYFDRNLYQVNLVFWVAVFVMVVGFCFVLAGVALSYTQPKITPATQVASIAGIITQIIGATFMVIYRSTMAQAKEFMSILERINTVGMAVQVLDSLPDGTDLKNETRANLAVLLLSGTPMHRVARAHSNSGSPS
jgi:Cyanobacterial TRADD-N associated 2-Transmembrane domain